MAAGRSRLSSRTSRGAHTGQGAEIRREGLAPLPSLDLYAPTIDSLEEICGWLGTFRERLRLAHDEERPQVAMLVGQREARFLVRRAELS